MGLLNLDSKKSYKIKKKLKRNERFGAVKEHSFYRHAKHMNKTGS